MVTTTLQHTPAWVFGLFVALVALGVSMSFPRTVSLRRSLMWPLALLGLALMGVASAFGSQPLALPAWGAGLATALLALQGRIDTSAVRFSAGTRRFQVPGSWVPLVLMMALFSLKFGVGVALATQPELRQSTALAVAASAAYGLFSGVFLGRALALWGIARQALAGQAAALRAPGVSG
jgi:Na+/glutamate symporter